MDRLTLQQAVDRLRHIERTERYITLRFESSQYIQLDQLVTQAQRGLLTDQDIDFRLRLIARKGMTW